MCPPRASNLPNMDISISFLYFLINVHRVIESEFLDTLAYKLLSQSFPGGVTEGFMLI